MLAVESPQYKRELWSHPEALQPLDGNQRVSKKVGGFIAVRIQASVSARSSGVRPPPKLAILVEAPAPRAGGPARRISGPTPDCPPGPQAHGRELVRKSFVS